MDNTVGSLTQFQKSVLIGSILGDGYGYVRIIPKRTNAILEVNHSLAAKEYVDWKYKIFNNIVLPPPKVRNGNGKRLAYRFTTRQHPEITEMFYRFYQNGEKIVPVDLELNPIVVGSLVYGIWMMEANAAIQMFI